MSRIITVALFLLAARAAYRRGYMDARVDAVLPYWKVPRKRVEWALRQMGSGKIEYTEGDSVTVESRTAPGRDHPPARGRFASSRVIR